MAASLTCTSCSEDWLDLNPSTSVPTDQAFNTLEDAQSALNGIYRLASAHSYYGDNYFYYGDCRAADVNEEMKRSATFALAGLISDDELNADNIIPSPFDKRVVPAIAAAVMDAARRSGIAKL